MKNSVEPRNGLDDGSVQPLPLLSKLLKRGDTVRINHGTLEIEPASGDAVPVDWLDNNRLRLYREILEATDTDAFEYLGYNTGCYGRTKAGGVTLQFFSVRTGLSRYVIFNACLVRKKNSHGKAAGSRLPDGHFSVGKRSNFHKFWLSTGLPVRRLSDFHDYMGKLGRFLFTASVEGERINADTLRPLSLSAAEIIAGVPDNFPTSHRQASDILPTSSPDKKIQRHQGWRSLQPDLTTGISNHGNTVTRKCGHTGTSLPPAIPPEDQSIDEWLSDYCNASPCKRVV